MQLLNYQRRLSGPLLDRIDMIVSVSRVPNDSLLEPETTTKEQQNAALSIIDLALKRQHTRYKSSLKYNSSLSTRETKATLVLSPAVRQFLETATSRLNLSARSYFKVIKVARTIADLDDAEDISIEHLGEALQYRLKNP